MYTKNQLANINNPFQGKAKKVLCLCSAGLLRSPTAAYVLQREFGYNTRAAGVGDYALIPISYPLLAWADEIVVMEGIHLRHIRVGLEQEMTSKSDKEQIDEIMNKIIVLDIPDRYEYGNKELEQLIITNYTNKSL